MSYIKTPLILFVSICWFNLLIGQTFESGETYFGANDFIEYRAGNLPIILSAPHGGELRPDEIPDRDCSGCIYGRDSYTQELAREVSASIHLKTGCFPHMIINRLHRVKLDANRDIGDAADGDLMGEQAWADYHVFIDAAKSKQEMETNGGIFFDLHGHGHQIQRIELGYLLTATDLRMTDPALDESGFYEKTSIRNLIDRTLTPLSFMVRGDQSFGTILEDVDYAAVPSTPDLFPEVGDSFFSGGYNTRRHGSRDSGIIDAIQIECNQDIRFTESERLKFADSLAVAMLAFYELHYDASHISGCQGSSGVDDFSRLSANVFPNPTTDKVRIQSNQYPLTIRVYDALGIFRKEEKISASNESIDVSELENGLYYLQLFDESRRSEMVKLVVGNR